ncbi:MAG: hypothetical protein KBT12_03265 [Bacteroidales bacterium]|nr:hypothetical protein [Candidatus Physcousia equi]
MKKLLMAAALFMSTFAAKADDAITASLKVTSEKDAATVHVNLDNTSTFVAFQFDIAFPEGMTFDQSSTTIVKSQTRLVNGEHVDLSQVGGTANESTDFNVVYNWISDNKLRVIGYNLGNKPIIGEKGAEILAINVKATTATAEVTDWSAKFDASDFVTEANLAEMTVNLTNAENTANGEAASEWQKGDVDHNGTIDVFDISKVVEKSLLKSPADPFFESEADVDGNGKIDIFDVSWIKEASLGKKNND